MTEDNGTYLVEHIRDHLARDGRTNELEAVVTVSGTRIFINGIVATEERRDAVSTVVEENFPDHEVVNQTTVADYPAPEEAEHVR